MRRCYIITVSATGCAVAFCNDQTNTSDFSRSKLLRGIKASALAPALLWFASFVSSSTPDPQRLPPPSSQTDGSLSNFLGVDHNLTGLPHMEERAQDFGSLKVKIAAAPRGAQPSACLPPAKKKGKCPSVSRQVNQSLSKLYLHTQAYRLYVGWLKEGQENNSLSSKPAQHVNTHLRHLSDLLTASLQQVRKQRFTDGIHHRRKNKTKNVVFILRRQPEFRSFLLWKTKGGGFLMKLALGEKIRATRQFKND